MPRTRILRRPAARGESPPRQLLVLQSDRFRRAGAFALVGVLTYAVALVAVMPAKAALTLTGSPVLWSDVAGSAWNGEIALRDRVRVGWDAVPLRSLTQLALAADVMVEGRDTDVTGRGRMRPGSVVLEEMTGVAGWPLFAAAAPNLPFECDVEVRVDVELMAFGGDRQGIEGNLASGPGTCTASLLGVSSAPATLPALVAEATRNDAASRVVLAPRDNRGDRLAEATLTRGGRLSLTVLPAGSALLPGGFVPATSFDAQL